MPRISREMKRTKSRNCPSGKRRKERRTAAHKKNLEELAAIEAALTAVKEKERG